MNKLLVVAIAIGCLIVCQEADGRRSRRPARGQFLRVTIVAGHLAVDQGDESSDPREFKIIMAEINSGQVLCETPYEPYHGRFPQSLTECPPIYSSPETEIAFVLHEANKAISRSDAIPLRDIDHVYVELPLVDGSIMLIRVESEYVDSRLSRPMRSPLD